MGRDKGHRPKLILLAADSGQYGEQAEEHLEMALSCSRFGSLPRGGGIEGQKAGYPEKLKILENVYNAFSSYSNTQLDMKKWTDTYPDYWSIVGRIERMRKDEEWQS